MKEEEKNRSKGTKSARIVALIFVVIGFLIPSIGMKGIVIGMLIAICTFIGKKEKKEAHVKSKTIESRTILLPDYAVDYEKKKYKKVKSLYQSIGFKNVETVNKGDLILGILVKPGLVESVTINGKEAISGEWYSPNARVVITYHGKDNSYIDACLPFGVDIDVDFNGD